MLELSYDFRKSPVGEIVGDYTGLHTGVLVVGEYDGQRAAKDNGIVFYQRIGWPNSKLDPAHLVEIALSALFEPGNKNRNVCYLRCWQGQVKCEVQVYFGADNAVYCMTNFFNPRTNKWIQETKKFSAPATPGFLDFRLRYDLDKLVASFAGEEITTDPVKIADFARITTVDILWGYVPATRFQLNVHN